MTESAMQTRMSYSVSASAQVLEIEIYDTIGGSLFSEGVTAKKVAEKISRARDAKEIQIRINSGGGDVFEGWAIYNSLAAHSARKVVTIDGVAASMASAIAMVGDEIVMPSNSLLMIHNPSASGWRGGASDLRKRADLLDKVRDNLIAVYAERSGQTRETVKAQMEAETWFTAQEAKQFGYADRIIEPRRLAAQWEGASVHAQDAGVSTMPEAARSAYLAGPHHTEATTLNAADQATAQAIIARIEAPLTAEERRACVLIGLSEETYKAERDRLLESSLPGWTPDGLTTAELDVCARLNMSTEAYAAEKARR